VAFVFFFSIYQHEDKSHGTKSAVPAALKAVPSFTNAVGMTDVVTPTLVGVHAILKTQHPETPTSVGDTSKNNYYRIQLSFNTFTPPYFKLTIMNYFPTRIFFLNQVQ